MIYSQCCIAEWKNGICQKCQKPAYPVKICNNCSGDGKVDVIDKYKVHGWTISPPYKTMVCDECDGKGYIELELSEDLYDVE